MNIFASKLKDASAHLEASVVEEKNITPIQAKATQTQLLTR
jgi:hypothetical protein